jgi:hypothetical protein
MDRLTRRMTYEDRFARRWWCKKAARNYIRYAKRANRRAMRRQLKKVEEV